jgi:hypothetical protein
VVWEDWSDSGSPDATYAAIRHAGQPFSSATQIDSLSSDVYTAYAYTTVAAGTDGTLAVVALGMSYTGGYSYSLATAIDVATPAATALGAPTPLAAFSGLFDGTESGVDAVGFTVSQPAYGLALGAGNSTALVGGTVLSTTAQDSLRPQQWRPDRRSDGAGLRITDGDIVTHPLSTLAATYPWWGNPNPPVTDFSGAAIDKSGNGVFAGRLTTANSDLYYETQSVVAPLTVTTTSLPQGTTGKAYSAKMSASGGTSPYTWSRLSGTLPPGLSLSTAGVWSGTPKTAGKYGFRLEVKDSAGGTATKEFTIVVATPVTVTTTSLPAAVKGRAYSATVKASGGSSPYTWSRVLWHEASRPHLLALRHMERDAHRRRHLQVHRGSDRFRRAHGDEGIEHRHRLLALVPVRNVRSAASGS